MYSKIIHKNNKSKCEYTKEGANGQDHYRL